MAITCIPSSYRKTIKAPFFLRILTKVTISHYLMRYLTQQQLFSCNLIARSKRRRKARLRGVFYPLSKYAHKMINDWSIMLLNLYNSREKNTDSLRGSQSEWRPKIVAGLDVDGLKICSTCLFFLRFALRLNFSFVLRINGFLQQLVFSSILFINRLIPLAIQ